MSVRNVDHAGNVFGMLLGDSVLQRLLGARI
jgi:hypothetical protein